MLMGNAVATETPRQVLHRFYEAERDYMQLGHSGDASFDAMQETLDPEVVLHQSPDLPYGGEFKGHAGYRKWADAMRAIFDRVDAQNPKFYESGDTVVIMCDLLTRTRGTGEEMTLPMAQVVTVRDGKIVEFRPFYWNVPAYVAAAVASQQGL